MITDAIINFVAGIINFVINLLPTAPIIAVGNGAASGYHCCIALVTQTISDSVGATVTIGGVVQPIVQNIGNSPLAVLLDWQLLGFFVGCAMVIIGAFIIIKILTTFWMLAKL